MTHQLQRIHCITQNPEFDPHSRAQNHPNHNIIFFPQSAQFRVPFLLLWAFSVQCATLFYLTAGFPLKLVNRLIQKMATHYHDACVPARHLVQRLPFTGDVLDIVHGACRLLAGRSVEAGSSATRAHTLLRCAVQRAVAGRHVPQRAEQAQGWHLCGESHESHRRLSADVQQLLLTGKWEGISIGMGNNDKLLRSRRFNSEKLCCSAVS